MPLQEQHVPMQGALLDQELPSADTTSSPHRPHSRCRYNHSRIRFHVPQRPVSKSFLAWLKESMVVFWANVGRGEARRRTMKHHVTARARPRKEDDMQAPS